jgi:transposase
VGITEKKDKYITELELLVEKQKGTIKELNQENLLLRHQIGLYQKAVFGPKTEKRFALTALKQTTLEFNEFSALAPAIEVPVKENKEVATGVVVESESSASKEKQSKKERTDFSKLVLPDGLSRETIVIEPLGVEEGMVKIGEEVTEVLAIKPEEFYVKQYVRPKYAKSNKEGVVIAELPSRAIPSAKVDESLLAYLIYSKYFLHLPLDRILKQFAHMGMSLSDSTIGDWLHKSIELISVLFPILAERVKGSCYKMCDETTIKVLQRKGNKVISHQGYYWVYYAVEEKISLFEYHPGRGGDIPEAFLMDNKGYFQTDGYAAYDKLDTASLQRLACMAHARRKFADAMSYDKAMCTWMLEKMGLLYAIEKKAREEKYSHAQRHELRQQQAIPVLNEIKQWLDANKEKHLPKSPITKAILYSLNQWDQLCLYTSNGMLEIDNNLVENIIRPLAIGRKNYLFAGSDKAATNAGMAYSFIACCINHQINPLLWIEDTLRKLPDTKSSQLHTLLPLSQKLKEQ